MSGRKQKHRRQKLYLLWSRNIWIRREEVRNISLHEDKYFKNLNLVKLEEREQVDGIGVEEPVASTSTVPQTSCETSTTVKSDGQQHSTDKQLVCSYCNKEFTEKSYLIRHVRIHTGETPFECHICERKFGDKSALTQHIRTHTGEKPYTCDVCGRSFTTSSSLKQHKYTHTEVKPYACSLCDKRFARKDRQKNHELTHTKEKPINCDESDDDLL